MYLSCLNFDNTHVERSRPMKDGRLQPLRFIDATTIQTLSRGAQRSSVTVTMSRMQARYPYFLDLEGPEARNELAQAGRPG